MDEENLRYCAMCGQPLNKYQMKFCSRTCSALFQVKQRREKEKLQSEKCLEEEKVQEKVLDSCLDDVLDPSYSDKDFLGVPTDEKNEYAKYGDDILFSFTPNYSTDIPLGTATVYGTPKALADYQFEYFRKKNEIAKKPDECISLRIYMLTGNICGEAKDIATFQIAYEKLLEKATESQSTQATEASATENVEIPVTADECLNSPADEIFEDVNLSQVEKLNDLQIIAKALKLPEDATFEEVRGEFEVNKNDLPPAWIVHFEEMLGKIERGEIS